METYSLKPKDYAEVSQQGQGGVPAVSTLNAISSSFKNILHKAVSSIGNGLNMLTERIEFASLSERIEPSFAPDERIHERQESQESGRDTFADDDGAAERGDDRFDAARPERQEDYGRDQDAGRDDGDYGVSRVAERADSPADDPGRDRPQHDDAPRQDGHSERAESGDGKPAAEGSAKADDGASGEAQAASGQGEKSDGEAQAGVQGSLTAQAAAGAKNAEQVLSGLLSAVQVFGLPGQAAEQAHSRSVAESQVENAGEGLARALSAIGKQTQMQGGDPGRAQGNAHGSQGQLNANANANANANTNTNTQAQSQTQAATSGPAGGTAAQQAAALSRMVGEGNRVEVNVSGVAAAVVSKPGVTLVSQASPGSDVGTNPQHGQQSSLGHGAANMNPAAQQAAGEAKLGQAQQAAAQAAQGQAASGGEAKGLLAGAPAANSAGQPAQVGGAEAQTPGGPNGPGESAQSQQSAASQAAKPQRFNLPGRAVVDQVSVQISKAVKAGLDRINIQLRPAGLGRIVVRLEMTTDGRVSVLVIADNKDTMEMLQRDARELQQALADAGLQADDESLRFSLRGDQERSADGEGAGSATSPEDAEEASEEAPGVIAEGGIISENRVDIRA